MPIIGEPAGIIRTFLDAYALSKANENRIFNLCQQGELLYGKPDSGYGYDPVRPDKSDENLIRAFRSLAPLAHRIAERSKDEISQRSHPYRTSASFGSVPYWLAFNDRPCRLLAQIPRGRRPRSFEALHITLEQRHEPLTVTPARYRHMGQRWDLRKVEANAALENEFERRIRNRTFRVALSSLSNTAEISGESRRLEMLQPPVAFHVTSVGPRDSEESALRDALARAWEERAAILVLPELRMPPNLMEIAKEFLRLQELNDERGLLMVVAGSWHTESGGQRYNRCVVLDYFGEEIWSHDKLFEYVVTPENYKQSPEAFRRIGVGDEGGFEEIQRGWTLQFYDSAIGRIAVAICVGFFSPKARPLMEMSAADIFLVPCMTPSMRDVEGFADYLVRQPAFTFAANCGHIGLGAPSFGRWPASRSNMRQMDEGETILFVDLNDISA